MQIITVYCFLLFISSDVIYHGDSLRICKLFWNMCMQYVYIKLFHIYRPWEANVAYL
jgi:hypothetical protein